MPTERPQCVDLSFALQGQALARDHALALGEGLCRALPWLAQQAGGGIHPVRLGSSGAEGLLSKRSRLMVRVPRARVQDALVLQGYVLAAGTQTLTLGAAQVRELLPHSTLYAHSVAAPAGHDEVQFMRWVQCCLLALDIRTPAVCGKHHTVQGPQGVLETFSLMLHGLQQEEAVRVLDRGLGEYRWLGCGLFIPHKSAAAVGSER